MWFHYKIISWFLSVHAELEHSQICYHPVFIREMLQIIFPSPSSESSVKLINDYSDNINTCSRLQKQNNKWRTLKIIYIVIWVLLELCVTAVSKWLDTDDLFFVVLVEFPVSTVYCYM